MKNIKTTKNMKTTKNAKNVKNIKLREAIKRSGVRHWQVAEALGVGESTFGRMLRRELPYEKKLQVLAATRRARLANECMAAAGNTERLTLTVAEVGVLLGISRDKAYELAASRSFPSIHIGRRIIVPKAAFEEWLLRACHSYGDIGETTPLPFTELE